MIGANSAGRRHLPFEGVYNLRDIGGYPTADGRYTRWRTLLRADSLHRIPDAAQAELVEDYGLRTVIDLRDSGEIAEWPNVFAESPRVRYLNLPLMGEAPLTDEPLPPGEILTRDELYRALLARRPAQIGQVLARLAEPDAFPALVHCTAGKDRTGIVVALLLGVAGVPDEIIAEDYALSSTYLIGQYWEEARRRAEKSGIPWERWQSLLTCPPEGMLALIEHLQATYGGITPYLRAAGLTDRQVATLRTALVEDTLGD